MLDFARIVGFEWDAGNARKSEEKHAVSKTEAEQVFSEDAVFVVRDVHHSQAEERHQALGRTHSGRRLHITFTLRETGTLIRIVSARDMSRKERVIYGEKG